jgi:hypothetical protein
MYGQYRNSGIFRLYDYKAALEWYDHTPPIRGKGVNAGLRPLGHRNKMHFQIHKLSDDSIACRCWKTDVVTFHPDGVVSIKSDAWVSQTTAHFIRDVLGLGASVSDNDIVIPIGDGRYRLKDGLKIKRGDSGKWMVTVSAPHEVYHIDRKKMNALRKQVEPFRSFIVGMVKLREGEFDRDELDEALAAMGTDRSANWALGVRPWREDVVQVLPRLEKFIAAVAGEEQRENWYFSSMQMIWSGYGYLARMRVSPNEVSKHLDELLIATHPEVLLVSQCEPGVFKKNTYAKFKPYKDLKR